MRVMLAAALYLGGFAICVAFGDLLGRDGVVAVSVTACTLALALVAIPLLEWKQRRRYRRRVG